MTRPHLILEMEYFEPERGGSTPEQILDSIRHLKNPVVCFIRAGESSFAGDWVEQFSNFVLELRSKRSDLIMHLTASVWHQDQETRLREIFDSVLFVLDGVARPYYRLAMESACEISDKWNNASNHFLVLTGKPDRYHRIGLLYQLDQAGLLDGNIWSMHMTDALIEPCSKILRRLGCEDPSQWITEHIRNPDQSDIVVVNGHSLHYSGIPFDKKIYDTPLFQVVSETDYNKSRPAWITEKTALAMANRNPFLLVGVPGTLKTMKSFGFETFEEFCLHQDYDEDQDPASRMHKIVENVRFWIDNLCQFQDQVEQKIETNFFRFMALGKQYLDQAQQAVESLDIECGAADILPIFDPIAHASWKQWYGRIRDPQWPDCDRESDFENLPEHIQKECIEVFGYQPKERK